MQVVILAGGYGTRLSEETIIKPKPMVEIFGKPILLYIMEYYSKYGYNEFIICAGYKSNYIKEYFVNFLINHNDIECNLENNTLKYLSKNNYKWKIKIIDTGLNTQTAGRLKRIDKYLDDVFFLTYGDGLANVDFDQLIKIFNENSSYATITSINAKNKFGTLFVRNDIVEKFEEKNDNNDVLINGGFMVLSKKIIDFINNDNESLEFDILPKIASIGKLSHCFHKGFWKCMDTLKDKMEFEDLFKKGEMNWLE